MNVHDFFTNSTYLTLPTKVNPKVYLPIDGGVLLHNSFKLYNPFSKSAKIFKKTVFFIMQNTPILGRFLFPVIKGKQSEFSKYINEKLNLELTIGLYIASARDKVVLQLQNENQVYGYLKFPTSKLGIKRLLNEQNAINTLSKLNIVSPLIFKGFYKKTPFLITENIEGIIGKLDSQVYKTLLDEFKKNKSYTLKDHPRVIQLLNKMKEEKLEEYKPILLFKLNKSKNLYKEVFEHGDFAPWNIMKIENGVVPFDFEYFEEQGLEYLDEIKYHFQIQTLLNKKEDDILLNDIKYKVPIKDFNLIFTIFLIKEVLQKKANNTSIKLEIKLLKLLENE